MDGEEKKIYQFEVFGVPPLTMVLVEAENDRQNEMARTIFESPGAIDRRKKQKAIIKLIEHIHKTLA